MSKPTLSPTKITTYLACPKRYAWTYLDPRGRWYLRGKPTFAFGLSLHRALEMFHAHGAVDTLAQTLSAFDENWIEEGFSSAEEMAEAYGEGREILSDYVDTVQRSAATGATLAVERALRCDLGAFVLVGRIDRLDERPDGTLEIVDYKLGHESATEGDVADDVALACYRILVRAAYPGRAVVASLVSLRGRRTISSALDDAAIDELQARLSALGELILAEATPFPHPKPLCAKCEFLPLCERERQP